MTVYANSKIYAIRSHQTQQIYIGSTTQSLSKRLAKHKCGYRRWLADNSKGYVTSYEIVKYSDHHIELLANCPCENKEQLRAIEGQYIRSNECVNKNIPGRTDREYQEDNREAINARRKQYREDNREAIKAYREANREAIKAYHKQHYEDNRERIKALGKQYRQANAEAIKVRKKQYQQANAEAIKAQRSQRIPCSYCNRTFRKGDKSSHIKTAKHQTNYKKAYLDCFGEEFQGCVPADDY